MAVTAKVSRTTYIYALLDPRNNEVRYIGKSVTPDNRYKHHCSNTDTNRLGKWIRSLPTKPVMIVFDECITDWEECEVFWIAYFKWLGARLVNSTIGGEGALGAKHSEEARQKKSRYMRNIPESHRNNHREACNTNEYKEKQSIAQKNRTDRDTVSDNMRRNRFDHRGFKYSDESKMKMSQSHIGKTDSEETKRKKSQAITEWWQKRKGEIS